MIVDAEAQATIFYHSLHNVRRKWAVRRPYYVTGNHVLQMVSYLLIHSRKDLFVWHFEGCFICQNNLVLRRGNLFNVNCTSTEYMLPLKLRHWQSCSSNDVLPIHAYQEVTLPMLFAPVLNTCCHLPRTCGRTKRSRFNNTCYNHKLLITFVVILSEECRTT